MTSNKVYIWGNHYEGNNTSVFFVLPTDNPNTPLAYSKALGELVVKYRKPESPWTGVISCRTNDTEQLCRELAEIFESSGFVLCLRPPTYEDEDIHKPCPEHKTTTTMN